MLTSATVIHHFSSTASVHRELPALLKGTKVAPESDVGSNSESGAAVPRAVVVGAGFSEAELDDMRKIEGGNQVPWLYPDPVKSAASMVTGPFLMTVIVKRVKACLKANGVVEGSEAREEERGVWSF